MASSKYIKGTVSHVMRHGHTYYVDENGNGYTSLECHPESNSVCHRHEIRNYQVLNAKSPCHPFCNDKYGVDGVGHHIHMIQSKKQSPTRNLIKKSMHEIRRNNKRSPLKATNKILNRNAMNRSQSPTETTNSRLDRPIRRTSTVNRGRVNMNGNRGGTNRNTGGGGSSY